MNVIFGCINILLVCLIKIFLFYNLFRFSCYFKFSYKLNMKKYIYLKKELLFLVCKF